MGEQVLLKGIVIDLDVQVRDKLDRERVALFATLYSEKFEATLPPNILIKTAEDLVLADGFTRIEAARQAGLESVEAEIRVGTKRDAVLTNIEANANTERRSRATNDGVHANAYSATRNGVRKATAPSVNGVVSIIRPSAGCELN